MLGWSREFSLVLAILVAAGASRPARYAALLQDGTRLEGAKLRDWHDELALPLLDGQPLLTPANPLRWLRDRSCPLAEPPSAFVEFTNGDRLPGVVTGFRLGNEEPFDPRPPHLIVRVAITFEPPENRPVREIRVLTQFVRRIVWQQRSSETHAPGTVVYRDGRALEFRALRFRAEGVHLLLADGNQQIDWSELSSLEMPAADPWNAWYDSLAFLCPTAATRLIDIETSSGLVACASLARFAARFEGNSSDADRWAHGLQPAWSLDILWVPFREIACYRTFAPHEIPLSRIQPKSVVQQSTLTGVRSIGLNRSVLGTPLRSKTVDFGWGLGVSGGTEIAFELPEAASSLRSFVCLDRAAGDGGCIRPRIVRAGSPEPFWEGPVLVGSERLVDTGKISLAGARNRPAAIILKIDSLNVDRPPGADPLDIRDYANWGDCLLELEPALVRAEIDRRFAASFAAWRQWAASQGGNSATAAGLELTWHRTDDIPGSFEPAVSVHNEALILERELTAGARDRWLIIAATHQAVGRESPQIAVALNGRPVQTLSVPAAQTNPDDVPPLAVPLGETAPGGSSNVQIRQLASPKSAPVHYRAITVVEQLPTIHRLLPQQPGDQPLQVANDSARVELTADLPIRAAPHWGEARFVRFSFRKAGGGRFNLQFLDAQPREESSLHYDLGPGEPANARSVHVWKDRLPEEWITITRDLFADFGNLDLKAVAISNLAGDQTRIGSIDFARTRADLQLLPIVTQP